MRAGKLFALSAFVLVVLFGRRAFIAAFGGDETKANVIYLGLLALAAIAMNLLNRWLQRFIPKQ